jgi:nucleoid DNA-binding protein
MQKVELNKTKYIRATRSWARFLHAYNDKYSVLEYDDMLDVLFSFIPDALFQGYTLEMPGVCVFKQRTIPASIKNFTGKPVLYPEQQTLAAKISKRLTDDYKKYVKISIK